jgi:GT2 family glycosyltransferase
MTAAMTMPLSVVICAYTTRRWDELCSAIESVLTQDVSSELELIVVIDHCEELYEMVRARFGAGRRVTVVANNQVKGLSGARNTGVGVATGEVVAFLDDDARAEPDWAATLLRHYADARVVGVGGYAAPVWPTGHRPAWMPEEFDWVIGCSYTGQPTSIAPVRNPIGCNMSLRRSVVEAVGGFRSEVGRVGTTPVGGEETELCIRVGARDDSYRILFDPDMRVHHNVSPDRVTLRYFVRRCYHEGLSKAVVADLSKGHRSLTSEQDYVRKVLPRGVLHGIGSISGDGLARAGAIMLGLVVTVSGYLRALVSRRWLGKA